MRKMSFIVLAVVNIYLLAAPLAIGQGGNVEQQIRVLSDQAVHASLKGDASFYEKYFADDATIIHSDGKLSSKAQEIALLKAGSLKYESIEVPETKIHVYGETAVVITPVSAKGTFRGKPFSGDYLATRIWMKQNGNWKVVEYQASGGAGAFQH